MGRVTQEYRAIGAASVSNTVNYWYNLDGSLSGLQTPPMKVLYYTYNGAGQATSLFDNSDKISFAVSATYAPPGELAGVVLGAPPQNIQHIGSGGGGDNNNFPGFTVSNAYNNRFQPILLSASTPTGTIFSECFDFHLALQITTPSPCSFRAGAGDNGNVYTVVNNTDITGSRTQLFTYDSLNRIWTGQSAGSQWGEVFSADAWGNLLNRSGIGSKDYEELNCQANANNQLTTCSFTYDAAGNTTYDGFNSYVYDAENRMVWTSAGYRYIYDGDGKRVEKCQAGTATTACPTSGTSGTLYWRGTGSDTLAETDLGGNSEEEYLFFNGERIARRDVDSSGGGTTVGVHYYFSDHLGSHSVIYDYTGSVCEQDIDYYPYGGEEYDYCAETSVPQNYKFTGKERDNETGLDNFGARYNSSSVGRFMTPDWAAKPVTVPYANFGDPQTLNLYSYVGNAPVNRIDPDGHIWGDPEIKELEWTQNPQDDSGLSLFTVPNKPTKKKPPQPWDGPDAVAMERYMRIFWMKQLQAEAKGVLRHILTHPAVGAFLMVYGPEFGGEEEGGLEAELEEAAAEGSARVLQTGGNTIAKSTADELNKTFGESLQPREWGRALERLKKSEEIPNAEHGKIMSDGNFVVDGKVVGNVSGFIRGN